MIQSPRGPGLGFTREPANAVPQAIVMGMEENPFEVIRGREGRAKISRDDPARCTKGLLA
jgi:uncharacterized oxidoreductase